MKLRVPHKATAWAILAGISYVLCFPRYDLPALSVLFFPCLLMAAHAIETRGQAIRLGFLLSAMIAVGGFHWIVYVAQNFGDMPLPAAILLLSLFCLVAAPQMVAFLWIAHATRGPAARLPSLVRALYWAALFVALEYLAHFVKIFPENLGDTLLAFRAISQAAAIGGVPLLTFLPVFLGATLYAFRAEGRRATAGVALATTLVVITQFWGTREIAAVNALPSETLRVGFVQHNMDDAEKQFAQMNSREIVSLLVSKLVRETKQLAERSHPDLILWAETAYPMQFPLSGSPSSSSSFALGYANLVMSAAAATKTPLLFGGYVNDLRHDYNAGILLDANGKVSDRYLKQVLLVFGEYFPFDDWFPSLKTLNPMMGDFGRGPGPVPVKLPWKGGTLPLGVNICYEEILPEYMRGYVKNGARAFVNLTKDSWFGDTFEPWQHFQLSAPRAIEHRLPLIRATNTGLSGVVDATGEVRLISAPFREAYETLDVKIPLERRGTLYTLLGEWFAQACTLFAMGMLILLRRRAK